MLAARLNEYDPHWLDSLCLSGRALWARLTPSKIVGAAPVRTTPIALVTRKNWSLWHSLAAAPHEEVQLSHGARALFDYFSTHGASFFDDLVSGTNLLRSQAETALGELVSAGLVNADSYSGLRALLIPSDKKRQLVARRRRVALFGLEDAGRWSLIRKGAGARTTPKRSSRWRSILLRRYGVVFRKVLEREADWLPPWHALLRVFRRLEAQGKIRGGRFVAGMSGEQYALPDAVSSMRAIRQAGSEGRSRVAERRRSAQSHRHRHAGRARAGAHQESRAVSRRRAGGDARRRPVRVHREDGAGERMGGAPGAGAQESSAGRRAARPPREANGQRTESR